MNKGIEPTTFLHAEQVLNFYATTTSLTYAHARMRTC